MVQLSSHSAADISLVAVDEKSNSQVHTQKNGGLTCQPPPAFPPALAPIILRRFDEFGQAKLNFLRYCHLHQTP